MMSWNDYYKEMLKQSPDAEEIRKQNIKNWREQYPYLKENISFKFKDKYREFISEEDTRVLFLETPDEVNVSGEGLLKLGIASCDEILYIDYPWYAINFFDFESKDIKDTKNRLYSDKIKYILIKGWPSPHLRNSINDANAEKARKSIIEQFFSKPKTKFIVQTYKGEGEIFIQSLKDFSGEKKDVKYV